MVGGAGTGCGPPCVPHPGPTTAGWPPEAYDMMLPGGRDRPLGASERIRVLVVDDSDGFRVAGIPPVGEDLEVIGRTGPEASRWPCG
jgi:hypothetical protein